MENNKSKKLTGFAYLKKYNLEKLKKIQSELGKRGAKKANITNRKNKTGFWNSETGAKGRESRIKNSPYIWKGVGFMSNQERECAQILLKNPIKGVNCHLVIKNIIIDFFIGNDFVEYHPWDFNKRTFEQYYNERRQILDNNGFRCNKLIVLKSLQEAKTLNKEYESIGEKVNAKER